jgi:hypothetical protein
MAAEASQHPDIGRGQERSIVPIAGNYTQQVTVQEQHGKSDNDSSSNENDFFVSNSKTNTQ